MTNTCFDGPTLDDVLHSVIQEIFANGLRIKPSKGPCSELTGVMLEITNPRARFSRTESRGKLFSSLGELCWYLAGVNNLDFIAYYLPPYQDSADGPIIYGGYGPRLFNWGGENQVDQVISLLEKKHDSRQAVIQLFDRHDIINPHNDIPCTCTMQFLIRENKLQAITYMRSTDVIKGLPHDVFCFTMLQEIIARRLGIDIGNYKHVVGSLHLYDDDEDDANQFLGEGWQPTNIAMPPMPSIDPQDSIEILLRAELAIRIEGGISTNEIESLDPYWLDLIRLLQIYRYSKDHNKRAAQELSNHMDSEIYRSLIDRRLSRL